MDDALKWVYATALKFYKEEEREKHGVGSL